MRLFPVLVILLCRMVAGDIEPSAVFTVRGFVNDFAVSEEKLYVATDLGSVEIFDLRTMTLLRRIALRPVRNGREEKMPVRLLSVDVREGKVLIAGIVQEGFRAVWLLDASGAVKLVGARDRLTLKEARFDAEGHVVLGTFSSELIRYAPEEKARLYRKQVAQTAIGDMAMSPDRTRMVVSDESGAVRIVDARSGKILKTLPSRHLDNVYHVAWGGGVVVTGGNDRRVSVFFEDRSYDFRTDFPVYTVGVSPKGRVGVYLEGDEQALRLFDIETGKRRDRLVGHRAVVNQIRFLDETRLISSEKGPTLYLWRIGQ